MDLFKIVETVTECRDTRDLVWSINRSPIDEASAIAGYVANCEGQEYYGTSEGAVIRSLKSLENSGAVFNFDEAYRMALVVCWVDYDFSLEA